MSPKLLISFPRSVTLLQVFVILFFIVQSLVFTSIILTSIVFTSIIFTSIVFTCAVFTIITTCVIIVPGTSGIGWLLNVGNLTLYIVLLPNILFNIIDLVRFWDRGLRVPCISLSFVSWVAGVTSRPTAVLICMSLIGVIYNLICCCYRSDVSQCRFMIRKFLNWIVSSPWFSLLSVWSFVYFVLLLSFLSFTSSTGFVYYVLFILSVSDPILSRWLSLLTSTLIIPILISLISSGLYFLSFLFKFFSFSV